MLFTFLHYPTPLIYISTYTPQNYVCINWKNNAVLLDHSAPPHGSNFWGLLGLEFCYSSRSKEGFLRWVLRRISNVLQSNYLIGGHYRLLRQSRLNVLRWGWKNCFYWQRRQNLGFNVPSFIRICPYVSIPVCRILFFFSNPCSYFNSEAGNSIIFRMRHWICFSEISVLWWQEISNSFTVDIETFQSVTWSLSWEFEVLSSSFSFPTFPTQLRVTAYLIILMSLTKIF